MVDTLEGLAFERNVGGDSSDLLYVVTVPPSILELEHESIVSQFDDLVDSLAADMKSYGFVDHVSVLFNGDSIGAKEYFIGSVSHSFDNSEDCRYILNKRKDEEISYFFVKSSVASVTMGVLTYALLPVGKSLVNYVCPDLIGISPMPLDGSILTYGVPGILSAAVTIGLWSGHEILEDNFVRNRLKEGERFSEYQLLDKSFVYEKLG
ncbi:MAG: hypothetical protein ACI83O_000251 [Patescibacteria group bacterium]|jgi:hypothetical protein